MQDSEIIDLFFSRSERAISETAKKYGPFCQSIAGNILSNRQDAEECVSDTWLSLWNRIPPDRPPRLRGYLVTITRSLAIDKWRKINAVKRGKGQFSLALHELGDTLPSDEDMEEVVIQAELTEIINKFLYNLPVTERRVFICRYWYLDSIPEIARHFGFTQNKVKSMLLRTRKKLKTYLIAKGVDGT